MKRILPILFFLSLLYFNGFSQITPIDIKRLNQRIEAGKDTTFIINFWATWCSPCIAELPYFEKINSTYKNDKVKVLLVSLDFKSKIESAVKPFVKKRKLKSEVFFLDEANQQSFIDKISEDWSGAIPATLFVNQDQKKRAFYEQEFTLEELETTLKSFRNN